MSQKCLFCKSPQRLVFYELDFWSCHRVQEIVSEIDGSGEIAAVLELRDSSRPTAWPSERMHRMHELMTEDMTAIMVKNLTTTASSAGNGGKRQAIESLSGEPLSVQISENYRKLPLNMPANSPHAVRLSHVRRSIYNAGLDTLRDFDEKTRHWEVDRAASDMIGWKTTVKAWSPASQQPSFRRSWTSAKLKSSSSERWWRRVFHRISAHTARASTCANRPWRLRSGLLKCTPVSNPVAALTT